MCVVVVVVVVVAGVVVVVFSLSLSLVGNSGSLSWVRHCSRRSSATHSYRCVRCLHVAKQWLGC